MLDSLRLTASSCQSSGRLSPLSWLARVYRDYPAGVIVGLLVFSQWVLDFATLWFIKRGYGGFSALGTVFLIRRFRNRNPGRCKEPETFLL